MGSDKGKSYLISHLADGTYAKDVIWWEIASHYEKKTPGILKDLLRIRENAQEIIHSKRSGKAVVWWHFVWKRDKI